MARVTRNEGGPPDPSAPPPGVDPQGPAGPQLPAGLSPVAAAMMNRGAARAESVIPPTSAGRDFTPYPAVDAAAAFVLVFDVHRWTIIDGLVVPELRCLHHIPGVDGVDRGEDGLPDATMATAQIEARGGKIIPFEIDGPGTSYMVRYQVGTAKDRKTGAIVPIWSYHTKWETLWPGSGEIGTDAPAYARWLRSLVDRGFLPEPRPYVLERLRSHLTRRVDLARIKANGQPNALLARYERDLNALLAHAERLGLGPPAKAEPATVPV